MDKAPPDQIDAYIARQPAPKRCDLLTLHQLCAQILPDAKRWFLDGRNAEGKAVTNPNIGFGSWMIPHADGSENEFYRIGLSANATGISVYIMTLTDKTHLTRRYADRLGKASVTGCCIRFRALKDIDIAVLAEALRDGAYRG